MTFVGTLTTDKQSFPVRGESHQAPDGDWFGTLSCASENTPALRTGPVTLTLSDGAVWHIVVAAIDRAGGDRPPKSYFRIDRMHSNLQGPHARTLR